MSSPGLPLNSETVLTDLIDSTMRYNSNLNFRKISKLSDELFDFSTEDLYYLMQILGESAI